MKVDFSKPILGLDKKAMKADKENDLLVEKVCVEALLASYQDEQNLAGEEKVKRYNIASKIYGHKEPVEVTVEEVAQIKKLVGKAFGPAIVGPVFQLLEGQN